MNNALTVTRKPNNYKNFTFFEGLILQGIDLSNQDDLDDSIEDNFYRVSNAYNVFREEKKIHIIRLGEKQALKNWFQGLTSTVNLPFDNLDIMTKASEYYKRTFTDDEEYDFMEKYWDKLTDAFLTLKNNL